MAQNKLLRFGPVALVLTTPTNIINPTITSLAGVVGFTATQPYVIIRHVRIVNITASAATCTFAVGTTGVTPTSANSVIGFGLSVAANSYVDWYGQLRLDAADFLVGFANTTLALTFEGEGEIGFI